VEDELADRLVHHHGAEDVEHLLVAGGDARHRVVLGT
jgi:hypothetical protein